MNSPFWNSLLAIIWLGIPVVWYAILRAGGFYALRPSIPSAVVNSILLFQYLGFPILYLDLDEYRSEFIIDKDLLLMAWMGTSAATTLLCLGVVIARNLLIANSEKDKGKSRISSLSHIEAVKIFIISIVSIFVLLAYINKIGFSNLALIIAISQSGLDEVTLARSMMGNDFGSNYHWYNVFMRHVLTLCVLALFASLLIIRRPLTIIFFFLLVIFALFSLLMAAEKGLIADFVISMFLVYIIIKESGRVSLKLTIITGFVVVSILAATYIFFMGNTGVQAALWSIISRTLTGSMQPLYHYLEFFPAHQEWLFGRSFPNPGGILPFVPYILSTEVMNFAQPEHISSGVVGTMPTIFWGELYANFGTIGVILLSILLGVGLYMVEQILRSQTKSVIGVALFVWAMIHYKNISITSFSTYLIDFNLLVIVGLYLALSISFTSKSNPGRLGDGLS